MPKEKKHGRNSQSRDQQISELVAAIVGYYDLKAKGKVGLRRCLTLLCKHYGSVITRPFLRNVKAIKDPVERKVVKAANERAAKRHENAQLLVLAVHLGIESTHCSAGVNRLGILSGIAEQAASNNLGIKRRRTQGPAGGSPGMDQGINFDGGSVPVPLSPIKHMPPPATARPVMPVADALSASCDLSILIAAAEAVA